MPRCSPISSLCMQRNGHDFSNDKTRLKTKITVIFCFYKQQDVTQTARRLWTLTVQLDFFSSSIFRQFLFRFRDTMVVRSPRRHALHRYTRTFLSTLSTETGRPSSLAASTAGLRTPFSFACYRLHSHPFEFHSGADSFG